MSRSRNSARSQRHRMPTDRGANPWCDCGCNPHNVKPDDRLRREARQAPAPLQTGETPTAREMAEEAELDAAWRAYCLEQCDALAALRGYSVLAAIVDAAHVSLSEQTESVEAWTAGRLVVPSDGVTG